MIPTPYLSEEEARQELLLLDRLYPEYTRLLESRRRMLRGAPGLSVGDTLARVTAELHVVLRYQRRPDEIELDERLEKLTPEELSTAREKIQERLRQQRGTA